MFSGGICFANDVATHDAHILEHARRMCPSGDSVMDWEFGFGSTWAKRAHHECHGKAYAMRPE